MAAGIAVDPTEVDDRGAAVAGAHRRRHGVRGGEQPGECDPEMPHEVVHGPQEPYGYFQRPSAQDAKHLVKGHGAVGREVIHPSLLVLQQEVHDLYQIVFVDVLKLCIPPWKDADLLAQVPGSGLVNPGPTTKQGRITVSLIFGCALSNPSTQPSSSFLFFAIGKIIISS